MLEISTKQQNNPNPVIMTPKTRKWKSPLVLGLVELVNTWELGDERQIVGVDCYIWII